MKNDRDKSLDNSEKLDNEGMDLFERLEEIIKKKQSESEVLKKILAGLDKIEKNKK